MAQSRPGEGTPAATQSQKAAHLSRALLLIILLVALFLRTYRLSEIPAGVDYDEAGNLILAGEIAAGESYPVFIRAYAGREALFYWLAAGTMRLLGHTLFAFRLSAACRTDEVAGQEYPTHDSDCNGNHFGPHWSIFVLCGGLKIGRIVPQEKRRP